MKWFFLIIGLLLNATANILLKVAARHVERSEQSVGIIFRLFTDPFLLLGIISFGLALGAYSYSLTKFDLSVAYPIMTSLGLVIVALFSFFFFKESYHVTKILGTILILIGVILVAKV